MNVSTSVYLNLVRFTAAVVVFLCHFAQKQFSGSFLWQMGSLGNPAVAIFFVLSGFMIGHVSAGPHASATRYGADRAARILSVSIPAVAATFILDWAGQRLSPGVHATPDLSPHGTALQLVSGLLFLNESWLGHIGVGSNLPYWSMAYEVWYYVAFGFLAFGRGRWTWGGMAAALLIAGPRIASLFPLWLFGVAVHRYCRVGFWTAWVGAIVAAGILAATLAYTAFVFLHGGFPDAGPIYTHGPMGLVVDYAVGLWFGITIIAVFFAAPLLDRSARAVQRPAAALASITLTLYLFHWPLMEFLRSVSPWPAASWQNRTMVIVCVAVTVVAVARVTEQRRHGLRRAFMRLLPAPQTSRAG